MVRYGLPGYLLIALVTGVATNVHAQDGTGWGLSATIGGSHISDEDGREKFDGNSLGLTAEIEYRFTPKVALGFGGFSLGRADDSFNGVDTEIEARGYEFFGRLILPLSDNVDVYGRLAAVNYITDIEPGTVGLEGLFGDEATEFGLGLDFGRRGVLAYRVEARFFNGGDDETGALLTAGISLLF